MSVDVSSNLARLPGINCLPYVPGAARTKTKPNTTSCVCYIREKILVQGIMNREYNLCHIRPQVVYVSPESLCACVRAINLFYHTLEQRIANHECDDSSVYGF